MGSPITFSGFNQIDFNTILNAVMQQERRPLQALQQQKETLQGIDSTYADLVTRLSTLLSKVSDLAGLSTAVTNAATSSDAQAVAVTATSGAVEGRYDVVVSALARAQVTVSATTSPDTDTTIVAAGGSLTIAGVGVSLNGPVTLEGLAAAINSTTDMPVTASIIQTAPGAFRMVLTAAKTGLDDGFTVASALTNSTLAFTDTDSNGISGDSAADNAVQASDASVLINNIAVTSASNTLTSVVPGVTLALAKQDPAHTIVVTVSRDDGALSGRLQAFVDAYNDVSKFASDGLSATGGQINNTVLRSLRGELRTVLTAAHGAGTFTRLADVGIGFTRTGALTLNADTLREALQTDPDAVASLFADAQTGVFSATKTLISGYTSASGYVPGARTQLTQQIAHLDTRIAEMERRLAIKRATLQREYTAADQAMSRLNAQRDALSNFSGRLNTSGL